jgi:hypothetical protein
MFIGQATDKRQSVARGDLEIARRHHVAAGFAGSFDPLALTLAALSIARLRAAAPISG